MLQTHFEFARNTAIAGPVTDTYGAVDRSADVAEALAWQDRIARWPTVQAYKRRTYELVGAERPVLDVGSGTGHDLLALGAGAVGVDRSHAMATRAHERAGVVAVADAASLPFPPETFAAARADRVLQHVDDPRAAVAELARVVRPGGRVVLADPDQGSLVIHVPGARPELVASMRRLRRDVGYRHGTLARRLPELLLAAGLVEPTVDAFALVLTDPSDAFGLPGWVRYWRERGQPLEDRDVAEWEATVPVAAGRGFLYAVTYLVVSGRRPERGVR